ncbi:uncharacterized protein LOC125650807 isoform X2 [Ostrea edulis]|uniref:uncharacterized protein LOC125650807 isoform X1 n=1 Tax=Ostrea edulis TaxID=37623 RepID=UPI0020951AB6|nr:uncharacterized protein LOC125650807 isoform X1 [Ostrea edulis]XP_048735286.1 uncharacterized protein LOC125650807 isoform X2 [Ostrea edulis]
MKAAVALLAALGFVACVSAGSYGGVGVRTAPAYNYMQYQARPMYYAMRQPMYYGVQQGGGSGSGNLLGGSGNMFGAGGYGGGGSDMGSVLPILLVFLMLAIFAPLLIGSLASSNEALFESLDS